VSASAAATKSTLLLVSAESAGVVAASSSSSLGVKALKRTTTATIPTPHFRKPRFLFLGVADYCGAHVGVWGSWGKVRWRLGWERGILRQAVVSEREGVGTHAASAWVRHV